MSETELLIWCVAEIRRALVEPRKAASDAVGYRISLRVRQWTKQGYGICPRCLTPLDRNGQSYCDRCGQHLAW